RWLGIGGTYSTTYHQPLHLGRAFATPPPMGGGRAASNLLPPLKDPDAAHLAPEGHPAADPRHDPAPRAMGPVRRRPEPPEGSATATSGSPAPSWSTVGAASSALPPRSTGSLTRGAGSGRAGPSRSPARPRGAPSSSRPDRAGAAGASPRAGASSSSSSSRTG